jgi:general secretion pathway protein A
LQIILVGQPELRDKLARPELRQLAQRIVARCHLRPLSKADVANYVNHRLTIARGKGEIFSRETLNTLYYYSRGIPRLINVICDRALLGAFVQGKESVDRATLRKAAGEVLGDCVPGTRLRWKAALLAGILIFTGAGLLYFYFIGFTPPRKSENTGHMSVVSKPMPEAPQPTERGVSGTQRNNPEEAKPGQQEPKADARTQGE